MTTLQQLASNLINRMVVDDTPQAVTGDGVYSIEITRLPHAHAVVVWRYDFQPQPLELAAALIGIHGAPPLEQCTVSTVKRCTQHSKKYGIRAEWEQSA